MSRGKRKREDEGLDFGSGVEEDSEEEETAEEEVDLVEQPKPASQDAQITEFFDMNRIVEDDEEIRFSGRVILDDMPVCPCCSAVWTIREGTLISPGCGCSIHPPCPKCDKCEAHCKGHRK